jgi:4-hydroxybenzoate polyprenyltransferase
MYSFVQMMRISNSPTVLTNALVGVSLAGIISPSITILPIILTMILFYSAGMIVNDLFDRDIDRQERPERPLPRGDITLKTAVAGAGIFFVSGLIILLVYSLLAFVSGILLIGCIIFYNYWHKGNPLSPLLMAMCRMLVYITAFLAIDFLVSPGLIFSALGLGIYIVGLTYYAKYTNKHHHVAYLIAGVSLFDAVLLISLGAFEFAAVAILCFFLTLLLQRFVKGT